MELTGSQRKSKKERGAKLPQNVKKAQIGCPVERFVGLSTIDSGSVHAKNRDIPVSL